MHARRNYFRQQADVVMKLALNTSDPVQARLLLIQAYNLLIEAKQAASSPNVPADRGKSSGPQSEP